MKYKRSNARRAERDCRDKGQRPHGACNRCGKNINRKPVIYKSQLYHPICAMRRKRDGIK